jgi:hypothetical protein
VHIIGKARRERVLPLWKETAAIVKAWLKVRSASAAPKLFLNVREQAMTRSGFEHILAKHVATASRTTHSIGAKCVSAHVLRHTCAMHTLQATRDVRKVSLWLGHASLQSSEIYLRANPTATSPLTYTFRPPPIIRELISRIYGGLDNIELVGPDREHAHDAVPTVGSWDNVWGEGMVLVLVIHEERGSWQRNPLEAALVETIPRSRSELADDSLTVERLLEDALAEIAGEERASGAAGAMAPRERS